MLSAEAATHLPFVENWFQYGQIFKKKSIRNQFSASIKCVAAYEDKLSALFLSIEPLNSDLARQLPEKKLLSIMLKISNLDKLYAFNFLCFVGIRKSHFLQC